MASPIVETETPKGDQIHVNPLHIMIIEPAPEGCKLVLSNGLEVHSKESLPQVSGRLFAALRYLFHQT